MFGEELLIVLLQFVFELLFHLIGWLPWDILLSWRELKVGPGKHPSDYWLIPLCGFLLGGVLGGMSLIFLKTTILQYAWMRMANLLVAPLICGGLATALARWRIRRGESSNARLHFWFAFAFSVGLLIVRFTWAQRPS